MKHLLFTLTLTFFLQISLNAQDHSSGIQFFEGSWEELLEEASAQDKPIFIDAYTSWCGPCKKMAKETFPNQDVGEFFNEHFICYKSDMEKGEGPMIAKKFDVHCYPQLLFIDANETIIHRAAGYHQADQFIDLGEQALDDNNNYQFYKNAFHLEGADIEKLFIYVELRKDACLSAKDEINTIVELIQRDEMLQTKENHAKIMEYSLSYPSIAFDYFVEKENEFIEASSRYRYQYMLEKSTKSAMQTSILGETKEQDEISKILQNQNKVKKDILSFLKTTNISKEYFPVLQASYLVQLYSDQLNENTDILFDYVQNYYYHYVFADYYFYYITSYAETMIDNCEDKEHIAEVKNWLTAANKQHQWEETNFQLAKTYFILEEYDAALKEAEKVKLALEEKDKDTEEIENLIDKIKQNINKE